MRGDSARCSINSEGQCQSLKMWNEQLVKTLTQSFFSPNPSDYRDSISSQDQSHLHQSISCHMTYDVQIGNTILRGISYAELIELPLSPTTFIRRNSGDWMPAKNCVELTHVLESTTRLTEQQPIELPIPHTCIDPIAPNIGTNYSDHFNNYSYNQYDFHNSTAEEIDDPEEYYEVDEYNDFEQSIYEDSVNRYEAPARQSFIPTEEYYRCKKKRRKALIGVLSIGLAGLLIMGVGNTWRSNIFEGLSFTRSEGMGFVFKCFSFVLITMLIAIPYFVYSFFSLIYYSIRLHNMKH